MQKTETFTIWQARQILKTCPNKEEAIYRLSQELRSRPWDLGEDILRLYDMLPNRENPDMPGTRANYNPRW